MKTTNKIISIMLSVLLLFGCFESVALAADSNGSGTAEDPFKISTASQLQNINNNISAHYILTADIDLQDADFTPIGNADSGAFSGSFDGNGHTIKNLNVFSGKYAGLFGCNEGIIKNVKLENIYVYGTRYVGGVVGQNTELGRVEGCSVLSGEVKSDGGIYAVYGGGVCGYNQGSFIGPSSNAAKVDMTNNSENVSAGGLIGCSTSKIETLNLSNTGTISVYLSANKKTCWCKAGGLIGDISSAIITDSYNTGDVSAINNGGAYGPAEAGGLFGGAYLLELTNSYNKGNINSINRSSSSSYYNTSYYSARSGGLVGATTSTYSIITNSYNTGVISSNARDLDESFSGGLVGDGSPMIKSSYNIGNVSGSGHFGGLIGYAYSSVDITDSYNSGNVSGSSYTGGLIGYAYSSVDITDSYNSGNVSGSSYTGGLIGYVDSSSTITITNSYNSGNVSASERNPSYAGGLIGYVDSSSTITITNSYNSGNVSASERNSSYAGGFVGYFRGKRISITNSYNAGFAESDYISFSSTANIIITNTYSAALNRKNSSTNTSRVLTDAQMKTQSSFVDWDFDEIWEMPSTGNNGYPVLKKARSPLYLNVENTVAYSGATLQLTAYKNGNKTSDVTWTCTSGDCLVTKDGKVTAIGPNKISTITATDSQGNKANCNILVMAKNTAVALNNFTLNQGKTDRRNIALSDFSSGDFIISATSSNSDVIRVTDYGSIYISFYANKPGVATINYETYQGFKGSCTATVTNYSNSVDITLSSVSLQVGDSYKLGVTTDPVISSSPIIWRSDDETIAKVDSNGNVTAVTEGKTTIVATSNGHTDSCKVTVTKKLKPVTSMSFTETEMNIYVKDQKQLQLVCDPSDTTDTITYSSNNTSVATVSSSGLVTATAAGTAKITATASSGVKTYCYVTVKNYPVVVTGITLDKSEKDMIVGEVFKLTSTVTPSNATAPGVTWNSTDPTVATVSQSGTVEAIGAGKTLITAETENGIIAYCTVNVTGVASTNLSKIYVPNVVASESTTVDIPVMIERNPGISFASISVIYDPNIMEAVSVENGDVFGSVLGNIDEKNATVKLFFTSDTDIDTDGVLAKIKFNITDPDAEADVKVCYFPSEIRNTENLAVAFNLFDGRYSQPICPHTETEVKNKSKATCTKNGYTGDTYCKLCDTLIEAGETVKATGHKYSKWTTTKQATCTEKGSQKRTCSVCGRVSTRSLSELGHNYSSDWTIDKKATCTEAGSQSHHCTRCDAKSDVTEIKATGHKYSKWTTTTKQATCTEKGSQKRTCSVCGRVSTRSLSELGHNYSSDWTIDKKATCTKTGSKSHHCTRCDAKKDVTTIKATGHKYKTTITTKATTSKNGTKTTKCSVCGYSYKKTIAKISYVKLSYTSYTYNGKVKTPTVTVKDSNGNKLKKDTDYTVKYSSGRKNVGKYTVTVTFKGSYSGTKTLTFKINPKGTSISKLTSGTKKFTATWTKQSTQTSGYQLQYSTSSKMTSVKSKTISGASKTSLTVSGLKAGTKYYVRIRTYKNVTIDGKAYKYYSSWSSVKSVKTK